ncbi:DUF4397 domain-containing protein [Hymenobacter psychrophilus]|uniref:DUF4397 domain-containing protein n=1 Tax=Hymenobacter psychrophilus TaxID=651662 RepID=A0A1H3EK76_9BACT|nr:DUF4397 domain-containing protein [Hymenobacter psychrophilus]SDX79146.1 protein of unknown function [Hymenobacter psychrophilus]
MNLFSSIRPVALLAALPAMLAFSACSNDDEDPAPQQGRVLFSHAAASANVPVKVLVNDVAVGQQLNYGQSTGYLAVNAGSPVVKISVASSNATAATETITVTDGQNYSAFAYAPTATTVGLLAFPDDLTAPAAGQAKVRVVHLIPDGPSPVKLSQVTVAGTTDVPGAIAAFKQASAFASIPAGSYNLVVTTGTPSLPVVTVGDGTGTGASTATKNYEAGKIYTIVVRGLTSSFDTNLQAKAVVIANN